MNPPHAGRSTRRVSFYRCIFNSFFFILKTVAPFPQRWGLLRKGRAVFRREDLRFEKLIV
jgi:hypothetical protein